MPESQPKAGVGSDKASSPAYWCMVLLMRGLSLPPPAKDGKTDDDDQDPELSLK
jgi:hypothetical protein